MTSFSTEIHTPAASAPATSGKVAICKLCKTQWQVQAMGEVLTDALSCDFCGCSDVTIVNEDKNYPQPIIKGL